MLRGSFVEPRKAPLAIFSVDGNNVVIKRKQPEKDTKFLQKYKRSPMNKLKKVTS